MNIQRHPTLLFKEPAHRGSEKFALLMRRQARPAPSALLACVSTARFAA
jgi:hypothetical protein